MERNECRNGDVFQGLSQCRCRLLCRAPFSGFLELKTKGHGDRKSPILEVVGTLSLHGRTSWPMKGGDPKSKYLHLGLADPKFPEF